MHLLATTLVPVAQTVADKYGDIAFGLVSLIVVMICILVFYKQVLSPSQAVTLQISEANAKTTQSLEHIARDLAMSTTNSLAIAEHLKRQDESKAT